MKVKLLKDHLGNKKGDAIEVDEARKRYWQAIGLIAPDEEKEKKEVKVESKKVIDKPATKHKK